MLQTSLLYALMAVASPQPTVDAPPPCPVVATPTVETQTPCPQARDCFRWTVGNEIAFNGLTGLGLAVSYNITPQWALDAGLGLALFGLRGGLRGRYNLTTRPWSPFVGLGLVYRPWSLQNYRYTNRRFVYKSDPAPDVHATVGMAYQGPTGFRFMGAVGWSQPLGTRENVSEYTSFGASDIGATLANSLVLSLMVGHSY